MPVEYAFFENPALVCIRYHGHIIADDLIAAATRFGREMAAKSMHPHFFDFSAVTGYTIDYPKFMSFMAFLADIYPSNRSEQLFVFYAPPGAPAEMAQMAQRPWEGNCQILIRIAETRGDALDILGGTRQDLLTHLDAFAS